MTVGESLQVRDFPVPRVSLEIEEDLSACDRVGGEQVRRVAVENVGEQRGAKITRRIGGLGAVAFTLVAIGSGLAAAVNSVVRASGRGPRLKWLIAGLAVGLLIAVLL